MQTVTDAVRQLLDGYAKVTLAVYIDGEKLDVGVDTGSYTGACAGDDEFSFGNACAADANITIAVPRPDLKNHRIQIKWAVDGTEYPLISGKVLNAKVTAGRTEIEAWDDMYFAGSKPFVLTSTVVSDCTAAAAFAAVADSMGVPVDTAAFSLLSGITIPDGLSGLNSDVTNSAVAGYIAGLVGGSALMSRAGLLTIRQYTTVDWETEPYSGGASAENEAFSVTGITLQREYTVATPNDDSSTTESTETAEYSAGDGSLMLSNPLSSQAAADSAFSALSAVTVRPGNYSFPGGLLLEPGDIFTVRSMDGSYAVAVGSISMSFDGGVRSSVACGGAAEEDSGAKGAINQTLKALIADYAKFKKLAVNKAQINNLTIGTLKLTHDGVDRYCFSDVEELNAFVESTARGMVTNTQKLFGVQLDLDPYYTPGVLTISTGYDADGRLGAFATVLTGEYFRYRTAFSEGDDLVLYWSEWSNVGSLTASDVGAAPATEDVSYPGCYYRIVDKVKEWINPPMVSGEEYRTTERFDGKVVYTRLVNCGEMTSGSSVTFAESVTAIRYAGFAGGVPLPHLSDDGFGGTWALWIKVNGGTITLYAGSGYENTTVAVTAQVWYTKD